MRTKIQRKSSRHKTTLHTTLLVVGEGADDKSFKIIILSTQQWSKNERRSG